MAVTLLLLGALPGQVGMDVFREAAAADGVELLTARLLSPRSGSTPVYAGEHVYVFHGWDGGDGNAEKELLRFDPATEKVDRLHHNLPFIWLRSGVWTGDHVFLFGGKVDFPRATDVIHRYDPDTNRYEAMGARLPGARWHSVAVWDDTTGHAYVLGGWDQRTFYDQVVRYDPATDTVQTMEATLPSPRWGSAAVWTGSEAYVFGGVTPDGRTDEVVRYTPGSDTAEVVATLPVPMDRAGAAYDGERYAYVFGGCRDGTGCFSDEVLRFDTHTHEVALLDLTLPGGRIDNPAVWVDGGATIFGGGVPPGKRTAEILRFTPNQAPEAHIAPVPVQECVAGGAVVGLDGGASSDPDGEPITFAWSADGVAFDDATSTTPMATFPVGATEVTLTVSDGSLTGTATAVVEVVDSEAPVVRVVRPAASTAYLLDEPQASDPLLPIMAVGALTVEAVATDACGVAHVDFTALAGGGGSADQAPYAVVVDPLVTESGENVVRVLATDLGGNVGKDEVAFVHVGTGVPPAPALPEAPEVPDAPEAPDVPEAPDAPDLPGAP